MHIIIKNKKIIINNYKVKCAVGKRGINIKKKEGDNITPKGKFKIKSIFYRKDRISNLKTDIIKFVIQKNMGWCDDSRSKKYNKLIRFPFNYSAEKLYRHDNIYDILLVLNFNTNPVRRNKGSAIFIHIAKKKFEPTEGCVAVSKRNIKNIIEKINKKTTVMII
jgi:L,D-peptidoglycan transpeptidase YkuD (ErfK/YbiS/YcfS/YnhG family)